MTISQMAIAAGADLKWLQNASALLNRKLRPSRHEAKLWALVRILVSAMNFPLKVALSIASNALKMERLGVQHVVSEDETGIATIVLNMIRFESVFHANLSRALVLETPRRRGRPEISHGNAIARAIGYGIDVSLLKASLLLSPAQRLERLNANAEFLRQFRVKR